MRCYLMDGQKVDDVWEWSGRLPWTIRRPLPETNPALYPQERFRPFETVDYQLSYSDFQQNTAVYVRVR